MGNVTVYEYDARGNLTREAGAVYPTRYEYDVYGNRTAMTTFRDEDGEGDRTEWTYDAATGAVVAKSYADGHGVVYALTDLGRPATRTDARGIVTTYTYNVYGDLVSQTYSDGTPAVTYDYDVFGRQAQATDAAGTTTFGYNQYGELETEAIVGEYTKTLTHHVDTYGRDAGYSVNGSRRQTIGYDAASGRIATMNEGGNFAWTYLPGTNLKASLTYPNGLVATWDYEPTRDLLATVENTLPDGTLLSRYAYANDALGRRTEIAKSGSAMDAKTETYAYDFRDQLVAGQGFTYAYDDIGNRTAAEGRDYTANNLNQYTAIDAFAPTYDLDGNQTAVLTETGVWQVEYNAENRPVRWTQGTVVVTMGYDRLGRRVFYKEMDGNRQMTYTKFLYDGYLCIQQLFSNSPWNVYKEFIWDPTEPVATRPLCFRQYGQRSAFFMHDGNKNVTDVVTVGPFNEPVAHYDYAPCAVSATGPRATDNPFRFSSEFHDPTLALVYYNYRHYNPKDGRWTSRDPLEEGGGMLLYCFGNNQAIASYDWLGLLVTIDYVANGERKTIRLEKFSLETLLCWLKCIKAQKGIIRQIDFVGHGNDEMILINDIFKKRWPKFPKADGKEGTLALTADDTGIYLRELIDTNGNEKKEDISDTLGDITDSNTVITLNGCNTASGEDNVTRKISNQLPETTVTGNQGFTVMPTWDDVPFNNSVFPFPLPPGRQSYVGGMSL